MGSPNFSKTLSKVVPQTINRRQGVITGTLTALALNVDGAVIPFRCIDPLVVAVGDTVAVDLVAGPTGQAEAWVVGRLAATFRPATGTVKTVPPSSSSITVTGTDGIDYTAYFITSYTPVVGDNVDLSWAASTPYVVGKVGTTAAPPPPPPPVAPPPPPPSTGTSTYAASDSASYTPAYSGWDKWAGGGGNVYQGGSAYGAANYGAWFYAGSPGELSGRTITRIRFNTGARRAVGSYNSPVTVNFYAHNNVTRPAGDVSRITGPAGITIQPGASQTVDLPLSFAGALQAGGGISIAGEPYAGFNGRYAQPDSGLLTIDWSR